MEAILSPNDYRLYIVLTAIAIAGLGYVWSTLSSPLAKVPGPFYSNFTGDVLKFYWLTGKRASYVHRLHKKYGSSCLFTSYPYASITMACLPR